MRDQGETREERHDRPKPSPEKLQHLKVRFRKITTIKKLRRNCQRAQKKINKQIMVSENLRKEKPFQVESG